MFAILATYPPLTQWSIFRPFAAAAGNGARPYGLQLYAYDDGRESSLFSPYKPLSRCHRLVVLFAVFAQLPDQLIGLVALGAHLGDAPRGDLEIVLKLGDAVVKSGAAGDQRP